MPIRLTHAQVCRDLRALSRSDADLRAALRAIGDPPPRQRPPGFASLARIIVGQQVSTAAASGIWTRITAAVEPLTPERIAAQDEATLRALGLSRQKALYLREMAQAVAHGALDLDAIARADDERAIAALLALKGVGRWTAEIYLLFSLGRRDIFPAGDLALQVGLQRLKRLRKRPDPERTRKLTTPWSPLRGAAAHFLWHYYAALKQRDGAGLPT
jgi:DNA-3-methyladenine glycosylase II